MTAQELYRLPGYDAKLAELVRGMLRIGEPCCGESSEVGAKILIILGGYVLQHQLGTLTGEAGGYRLERNPDTVRIPDVGFVRRERAPKGMSRTFFDGAPDLAVEVLSPSDRLPKALEKVKMYLAAGTQLVWLIDPEQRTATIYRPDHLPELIDETGILYGEDVVPGFQVDVASILPMK